MMPDTYEEVEAKIQGIIDAIPPGFKPNIAGLLREKGVPYQRLLACYHGYRNHFDRPSATLKLNESQNYVL